MYVCSDNNKDQENKPQQLQIRPNPGKAVSLNQSATFAVDLAPNRGSNIGPISVHVYHVLST